MIEIFMECNDDGTATIGLIVDNSSQLLAYDNKNRIRINKAKVLIKLLYWCWRSKTLTTYFYLFQMDLHINFRFIIKDDLSGQKTKGGVKKVLDCIDDPSPTTTTTLPGPPTINPSVSNTRNACSGGAKLTHFHMANSDSSNANAYFLAQYSLDGGESWSTLVSNQSVAPGSSEMASVNVPSGQNVRWRYKTSTTPNSFSGGWKRWGPDFTVDCPTTTTTLPGPPIINPSVSNTREECSGGAKLIHFNMANSDSSNANAYFLAEYSLDGGENWSTLVSNQSVAPGSSERGSVNVPSGQNVRWRYKTSTTSNSFSGGWKRWGPSFTVDCPTTTTTDPTQLQQLILQ